MAALWWIGPNKPADYGPKVASVISAATDYEWGPGKPRSEVRPLLENVCEDDLLTCRQGSHRQAARACLAGLWLLHNFLEESHQLSQSLPDTNGSYWHGIMHRREPDYANANYWFRRVGRHPVWAPLAYQVQQLRDADVLQHRLQQHGCHRLSTDEQRMLESLVREVVEGDQFNPFQFVDVCQRAANRQTPESLRAWCRHVGWLEWQLLFDHCYHLI